MSVASLLYVAYCRRLTTAAAFKQEALREAHKENKEMQRKTMGFDKDVAHAPRGLNR